ncbi:hypothetical protein SAMN05216255_3831 [Pseudomonas segetis]|uniref:Uncharacterized protein n=1 Tax=Pseudomonas segetis TaxID=298908 RepID=A0A239IEM0_9PSED|nr:hypothetical protein SAMN05216255_3831 [Pseudomonas segetis]
MRSRAVSFYRMDKQEQPDTALLGFFNHGSQRGIFYQIAAL